MINLLAGPSGKASRTEEKEGMASICLDILSQQNLMGPDVTEWLHTLFSVDGRPNCRWIMILSYG